MRVGAAPGKKSRHARDEVLRRTAVPPPIGMRKVRTLMLARHPCGLPPQAHRRRQSESGSPIGQDATNVCDDLKQGCLSNA
jgi:hypothetical protein